MTCLTHHPSRPTLLTSACVLLLSCTPLGQQPQAQDAPKAQAAAKAQYWKGNLHTHTFWSDGNHFPEMAVDWYRQRNYNFLALTDHNVLS